MNSRELFNRIMRYEPVDRIPMIQIDPNESLTVDRWRTEGLPQDKSPAEFMGLDNLTLFWAGFGPIPWFEHRRIAEDDVSFTEIDGMGTTVRRLKAAPNMYYGHLDHPVKNADDWRRYKERLLPSTPGRLPADWPDGLIARVNAHTAPVILQLYPYFFRWGFYLMGMERFLTGFYDTPELLHEMFAYYADFMMQIVRPLLGRMKLECVVFAEDLAHRGGPHISPAIYRDFWRPYQEPMIRECKAAGITYVVQYTSGDCRPLLPLMMEMGFNMTWPCERNAGMDPLELRRTFGRELRLVGGVGHTCLAGGRRAIDAEIDRLLPLVREGGFIPCLDDMIPPEIPFENYRYCIERLRELRM